MRAAQDLRARASSARILAICEADCVYHSRKRYPAKCAPRALHAFDARRIESCERSFARVERDGVVAAALAAAAVVGDDCGAAVDGFDAEDLDSHDRSISPGLGCGDTDQY